MNTILCKVQQMLCLVLWSFCSKYVDPSTTTSVRALAPLYCLHVLLAVSISDANEENKGHIATDAVLMAVKSNQPGLCSP